MILLLWMGAAAADCRSSTLRDELAAGQAQQVDIDGDGLPDTITLTRSGGSGSESSRVDLSLSRSGETLSASTLHSFDTIIDENPIPLDLLRPEHAAARARIENALFRTTCAAPEASMQRVLEPDAPLEWQPGPLTIPPFYVVEASGVWLSYAGHVHGGLIPSTGPYPQPIEANGALRLLRTAHGIVVETADRSQHAWVYVFPGTPGHKLRWPSHTSARLDGEVVVLSLESGEARVSLPPR